MKIQTAKSEAGKTAGNLIKETELASTIESMCRALESEISAAKSDRSRAFDIIQGAKVHSDEYGHLYSFKAEVATPIPPETPIQLIINDLGMFRGVFVAIQDFDILIKLQHDAGENINRAKLTSEPWFIYDILKNRLQEKLDQPDDDNNLPGILLGQLSNDVEGGEKEYNTGLSVLMALKAPDLHPNDDQKIVLKACLSSNMQFVWGPPGTGKTSSLAQVVRSFAANQRRVLVLAHANAAIDVAMDRISKSFAGSMELREGKVLRLGVPQLPEIRDNDFILPEKVLEKKQPELVRKIIELENRKSNLIRSLKNINDQEQKERFAQNIDGIRKELAALSESFRAALSEIIIEAKVIGTTLSKFIIDDQIWNWQPDVSVIEEASMSPFPSVMAAALQSKCRQILFGDFRQLPPICLSESTSAKLWLGRDTFDIAGVRSNIDAGQTDSRVKMLETQYRMATSICDVVSQLAYNGQLKTDESVAEWVGPIVDFEPYPGQSLILIDTSNLSPICCKEPKVGSFSRINPIHCIIATLFASLALDSGSNNVGIISPYKANARLAAYLNFKNCEKGLVTAATVHRFQGSERDIIFFDLVDAPFEKGASNLTGRDHDTSLRLVNVGISRPKGKLVVIADVEFIKERHDYNSPSRKIIELIKERGETIDLDIDALIALNGRTSFRWFENWDQVQTEIVKDIHRDKGPSFINLQHQFAVAPSLVNALNKNIQEGLEAIVFTPISNATALEETDVDIRLISPPGGFLALIGPKAVYIGSCYPESCFVRFEDKRTSELMTQLFFGPYISSAPPDSVIENDMNKICGRCPDCGTTRRPCKNRKGEWVLRCKTLGHTETQLDTKLFHKIAKSMKIRCKICRSHAIIRNKGNEFLFECSNKSGGCQGSPPSIEELFGGH